MRYWAPDGAPHDVTVRGLGRARWAALLDKHPPRDGEDQWNEDTFPPALIAECTGRPLVEVTSWWDESTADAAEELLGECLRVAYPGSIEWAVRLLRRNPRRLMEVRCASRIGVSHSAFLAFPPDDQDLAMAEMQIVGDVCPGCGVPSDAMQNPAAAEVKYRRCMHCQAKAEATAAIPEPERPFVHVYLEETR
ncbi:hypothetical protein [Cellulomonas sp. C5510]|uniref:hypothetical protein n=1 Tax=Cellulomonas sp. C5510 TaxID=2871170 RepID=UPI001C95504E|nr:hypothetical protein [Cellulomonas sp. C5510]QZN86877.1 hypothetical protein K5O09_07140 [Cellulomonas sp. C5510]